MSKLLTTDSIVTKTKLETEVVTLTETTTVTETDDGPWIQFLGVSIVLFILLVVICAYAAHLHFKKHNKGPQQGEGD